ncbi:hypothetical protein RND64_19880 [Gordonia sp. w5E2]|nr:MULTISPECIES: hypothetical protein [Gordonia]UEA57436.1 hypothetical protein LK459_12435 [Gordonia otitidis]SKY45329.1 Uncharacterised protein [Mycobacteroides abscessus subsp. abscessus]
MSSRESVALREPGGRDLSSFPTVSIPTSAQLYRGHRTANGAWFFSNGGAGRFDLDAPRGTCYLGVDPDTAVREVLGGAGARVGDI